MKTLLSLFLLLALGASAATGIKISEYPNTPVLTNSELFIVAVTNVTPATNRNISYGQLRSLLASNNFVGSFTGDGRNVSNVISTLSGTNVHIWASIGDSRVLYINNPNGAETTLDFAGGLTQQWWDTNSETFNIQSQGGKQIRLQPISGTVNSYGRLMVGNTNLLNDNPIIQAKDYRSGKTTTEIYAEAPQNSNHIYIGHDGTNGWLAADGTVIFNGGFNSSLGYDWWTWDTTYKSRMVMDVNGNVFIGTKLLGAGFINTNTYTLPSLFEVQSSGNTTMRLTGGTGKNSYIKLTDNSTDIWEIGNNWNNSGDGNFYIYRDSGTGNVLLSPLGGHAKVGIWTLTPLFPLDVRINAARTSTTGTAVATFYSNESSGPAGLKIELTGGPDEADRFVSLQAGEESGANTGSLLFQQYGGNVAIGTTNTINGRLTVSGNVAASGAVFATNGVVAAGGYFTGDGRNLTNVVVSYGGTGTSNTFTSPELIAPFYGTTVEYGKIPIISYPIGDTAFIGPKTGNLLISDVYGGTSGARNQAIGNSILYSLTTGHRNVGVGFSVMSDMQSGSYNTVLGQGSLDTSTNSTHNSVVGQHSMRLSTSASYNATLGNYTLETNLTGDHNVAIGWKSLTSADASDNTAVGYLSGTAIVSGTRNTMLGVNSLTRNIDANDNVAVGWGSLYSIHGGANTAVGTDALGEADAGGYNSVFGYRAGANVSGSYNTILGARSAVNGITSGSYNIIIGFDPQLVTNSESGQLDIGNLIFGSGVAYGATLSSGKVGIATTNLTQSLTVGGSGASIGMQDSYASSDARNWGFFQNAAHYGDFQIRQSTASGGDPWTAGTVRLHIETNGYVGIGTISPTRPLTIQSASSPDLAFKTTDAATGNRNWAIRINAYTYGDIVFYQSTTNNVDPITSGAVKFLIDGTGNAGIGTTAPSERLTVSGNINASGAVIATNAFVMPPVSAGPDWCTNGLAAIWNSNTTVYIRTSAVGATTYADKLMAP